MEKFNIKIDLISNSPFINENGTFKRGEAINLSGKIAGVCYDKEGFEHLVNEPVEKTNRRIDMTLNNGHHSVYDHINITFNLQNVPKILAMILNNEHQYTTSEKSARYTPVVRGENSIITEEEANLYNKWIEIYKGVIKEQYGYQFNDSKIQKLAQENARYLVTVFMPTQMVYTTSLRQINYIASWMIKYINEADRTDTFNANLVAAMQEFINELERVNVLEYSLMKNEKHRSLSLFGKDLDKRGEYFGDVYATKYLGTFAELAQAQRHRTLDYQLEMLDEKQYFVPPILNNDDLKAEWLEDIKSVSNVTPQGELIRISEVGKYEDFILKCKERLCSAAQLEIMLQTKRTLNKYKQALEDTNHPLAADIVNYSHGARCTFKDFKCTSDCAFAEGKRLVRKI